MLVVENIYKSYKKEVLKGISFSVSDGEIIGIVGANGSGKSTLVSIITNNTKADKGEVTIDGMNIFKNINLLKSIGYVPQENVLFNKLTAKNNIDFWAKAYGISHTPLYFDKKLFNEKVSNLSGGNKKLLSIELALISNPKYLIMDEPTSALDLINQEEIMSLIRDYKSRGNSVVFITHNINEIKKCDKILIIQDGMGRYFDEPNKIFEEKNGLIDILLN